MDEADEYRKLPLEDRCVHKVWKARQEAYEELAKTFRTADDKSPEWNKYLSLMKKFVSDSHAAAQEKALEVVLAYVENSPVAGKNVSEVMTLIVSKCVGAAKAKTKDLAAQICLMYIEIEKHDIVIEELIKGSEHKNPKIAVGCVIIMKEAVRSFTIKAINVKPLLKKLPTLLEDRDKNVREESRCLAIEIYRCNGPVREAIKAQVANINKIQLQELEAEFDKVKDERAVPSRYLRSQQVKQMTMNVDAEELGGDDNLDDTGDDEINEKEVFELLPPVNILDKLPKDFYELIESKKWQERKDALDQLAAAMESAARLENGDYADLVRALKKVLGKDTNVILVGQAAKLLMMISKGLNQKFSMFANSCLSTALEKFKEKKPVVLLPLRDLVDAIHHCTNLDHVKEEALTALENKNPSVKAETALFFARCFTKCTPMMFDKKCMKLLTTALIKTLNESDPTVRDNSAEALGTLWKVVGEKMIAPYLDGVDALKMAKIKDFSEKAVIVAKIPKSKSENRPTSAPVRTTAAAATVRAGSASARPVRKPVCKSATIIKKSSSLTALAGNKVGKATKALPEKELSEEEVDEKGSEIFAPNVISGLADSITWKNRLAAVEQFLQTLSSISDNRVSSQVLIRLLAKKPGFKDNNSQVLKLRLDCLKIIAERFPLTTTGVSFCLSDIVPLLADPKHKAIVVEILMLLADNLQLDFVSTEVLDFAFCRQKNPKVQQEALNWLSNAILEFGFLVQPKSLMENIKKAIGASNPLVRTAVISLLGTMYLYMGSQLELFFDNEKPALQQLIQSEFIKHAGERPPTPIRGRPRISDSCNMEVDADAGETIAMAYQERTEAIVKEMVPRVDISAKIMASNLGNQLADRDWKVRTEGIAKCQEMINEAKYITPNLGDIVPAIAQRLTDSNGKLVASTIALCESIAIAMGTSCKTLVRDFLPGLLQAFGDTKPFIRVAAIKCVNTWGETCGYKEFFEGEMIASALKTGSPTLRTELWIWLAQKLPEIANVTKEELIVCLPHLYSNLEDRNSDVRKAAGDAFLGFMIHLGYQPMMNASGKLKQSSQRTVNNLLDKTVCNLPEKPAPPTSAPKSVKSGGAKRSIQQKSASAGTGVKTKIALAVPKQSSKHKEDEDASPLLKVNKIKGQRMIDEQKMKVIKWNFTTPRDEYVELLREQMINAGVNKTLLTNMLHTDFRFHLKAIEALMEDLPHNMAGLLSNLDLILKWMTLRFFDTNTSVLLRGLEYLAAVFTILREEKYIMTDNEASCFLPYLIQKTGDPKDTVRNSVRDLFDQIGCVYSVSKLFTFIMDGTKSKNARQRTGCLEQLTRLIENYSTSVCQPTTAAALKEIAKNISDRDNSVRNAAINCIVAAYFIEGEKFRQMIGNISEKDMSLLDERIKRAKKGRPVPVATVRPTIAGVKKSNENLADARMLADNWNDHDNGNGYDHQNGYDEEQFNDEDEIEDEYQPPPQVNTSPLTRPPKKGPFGLDMDLIRRLDAIPIELPEPNLIPYDLSYFEDKVIPMTSPPRSTKTLSMNLGNYSPINTATITRSPPRPSTLEGWIAKINSVNLDESVRALEEVEFFFLSDEKRKEVAGLEVALFSNIMNQLEYLYTSDTPDLTQCYRHLFIVALKIFSFPEHSRAIPEMLLQRMMEHLLTLLNRQRLHSSASNNMFVKCINNVVVHILEKGDHTDVVCLLMRMLHGSVETTTDLDKQYQELLMKCIWKSLKYFPEWDSQLDYTRILTEINKFLAAYPSNWWKIQSSDTPLRTVKTVVHTMVKRRGVEVMNKVKALPSPHHELSAYLGKSLRHLNVDAASGDAKSKRADQAQPEVSDTLREELMDIVQTINDEQKTTEGLNLLYDFKCSHPEVDIQPFLAGSESGFREYVKRGLGEIERERKERENNINAFRNNGDVLAMGDADIEDRDVLEFQKRLRYLQMAGGCGTERPPTAPANINYYQPSSVTQNSLDSMPVIRTSPPQRPKSTDDQSSTVEQLKNRLAILKGKKL